MVKKRYKLIGFYTDKKGRVRPITKRIGPKIQSSKRVSKYGVSRSAWAWYMDKLKRAKHVASSPSKAWKKHPERMDVEGVDTPEKERKHGGSRGVKKERATEKQIRYLKRLNKVLVDRINVMVNVKYSHRSKAELRIAKKRLEEIKKMDFENLSKEEASKMIDAHLYLLRVPSYVMLDYVINLSPDELFDIEKLSPSKSA